jgi:predicted MFS family arabinose efflux permease
LSSSPAGYFAAAACFGVYSGSFFFYFVFHSLVHPEHAGKYISINEAVVGLAGIAGPLIGGLLAANLSLATPFLLSAGMILAAIGIQAAIHARIERESRRM